MALPDLTVKIGGDASGLRSELDNALSELSSFGAKFGEGVVGAIGTGVGTVLVQQIIASGALQGMATTISSSIGAPLVPR